MPLLLALLLAVAAPVLPAQALAVADLPAQAPAEQVLDSADVLSRASRAEIEGQLQALAQDRVDARLITVSRLDYGLDLSQLGEALLQRWSPAKGSGADQARLLLLIDTQNKGTAIVASGSLERQLPQSLLNSTARTTLAQPLRQGDRYRQASLDALTRLRTVLEGGEDPGEPVVVEAAVPVTNIPTAEETRSSNALTWVVVLLVLGSVVPMLTWWVFSR
ncbi:MAG: photosystem II repair protein Psb32 [Cyanobium sp.]